MKTVQAPTVHLNGTTKDDLLDAIEDAFHAVSEALDKMRKTCPNGRDYQTRGALPFEVALAQHQHRLLRVASVMDELEAIATAIHEGVDEMDTNPRYKAARVSEQLTELDERLRQTHLEAGAWDKQ